MASSPELHLDFNENVWSSLDAVPGLQQFSKHQHQDPIEPQDLLHKHQQQEMGGIDIPRGNESSHSLGTSVPENFPQGQFLSMSIPDTELVAAFQSHVSRGSEGDAVQLQQAQQQLQQKQAATHSRSGSGTFDLRDEELTTPAGGAKLGQAAETDHLEYLEQCSCSFDATGAEPSRTLIIRNVAADASKEELRDIFQSFGDVRTLPQTTSQRGMVLVSYYDLRAAIAACSTLQGTLVSNLPLDIKYAVSSKSDNQEINQGRIVVFNLDPNTTNHHLAWLFSKFGEVEDVSESPLRANQKFVTFYDIRRAARALNAMNCAENLGKLPGQITPQQGPNSLSGMGLLASSWDSQASNWGRLNQLPSSSPGSGNLQGGAQVSGSLFGSLPTSDCKPASQSGLGSGSQNGLGNGSQSALGNGSQFGSSGDLQSMHGSALPKFSNDFKLGSSGDLQSMHGSALPKFGNDFKLGSSRDLQSMHGSTLPKFGNDFKLGSSGDLHSMHGSALPKFSNEFQTADSRAIHMSDSASSISANGQFFGAGPAGAMLGAKGKAAGNSASSVSASDQIFGARPAGAMLGTNGMAAGNLPGLPALYSSPGMFGNAPLLVDMQAQNLLLQSGMSHAEAAEVLMSFNLTQQGSAQAPQQYPPSGLGHQKPYNNMFHGGYSYLNPIVEGSEGGPSNIAAIPSAQWANNMFGGVAMLQIQQAGFGASAAGAPNHLACVQQLLQAAQLNQALAQLTNPAAGVFPNYQQTNNLASSLLAAQLLQQAGLGFGMPNVLNPFLGVNPGGGGMDGRGPPNLRQMGNQQQQSQQQAHWGGGQGLSGGANNNNSNNNSSNSGGAVAGDATRGGGRLSRRTTDPAAETERRAQQEKLYALNNDRIRGGSDLRTTLMIKNIPNKYTQKMLLATIDERFKGTYDFFYLPIDFKNKCNVGYAFINMAQPIHIIPLVECFNKKKWDRFNSDKICHISYARIQGRPSLVAHFQNSSLMHEDKRCRPILFSSDGNEVGEQEPFPAEAGMTSAGGSSNSLGSTNKENQGRGGGSLSKSSSHQKLTKKNSSSTNSLAGANR
eukprot:gene21946-28992_t